MRVGLVPISAKPYHAGHHALVSTASKENDKVMLFVSVSDRLRKNEFPIYGNDMLRVWKEELEKIMPENVEIEYGGSPVRKVYEKLGDANDRLETNTYTVYSDPEDTAQNYAESMRQKYFSDIYRRGHVVFAAEASPEAFTRGIGTPDISGTKVREMLKSGDIVSFAKIMPPGVDVENIFSILSKQINEMWLRSYIRSIITG